MLPSKFPNLLVNGANGIAVGMATSIPPHNLGEICDALVKLIDEPDVSIDELLEIVPGPDFPTGGIVCGRAGIRRGYHTGRGTITVRARARIEEHRQAATASWSARSPTSRPATASRSGSPSWSTRSGSPASPAIRNESDLKEPVRLVLELKRDADPEVVLNQLYQFSPLQDTFSLIFLALVDGKPRVLSFKELLEEFLRHRVIGDPPPDAVPAGQGPAAEAHGRRAAVGPCQHRRGDPRHPHLRHPGRGQGAADARSQCPAALLRQALGEEGFAVLAVGARRRRRTTRSRPSRPTPSSA